ncbi:hypothetical protein KPL70_019852 [Citrus sinensis]|nr:uncharacterized protein LOC18037135 [Citrus x clementina]XP_052300987.1 uncharacterized protein LOC102629215 isoform X1 [Citrus sinensis]KAH9663956.1 hypothetical protein KPL70_019852 [Citrus sinensis]
MGREEKRRTFHEAVVRTLYPSPPSSPPQEDQDNEPADKLDEDFDVALINPDDYLRSSASNNEHDNDDDEGEVTECGPEKLTRAQRKRLRKKKLKEDARRRRNIIGPLLPTTRDGDSSGRGGGGEINSPDVRQNADEKCATPSVESGEFSGCCNQKKLKHRRVAKRLAREQLKLSSSVPENNRGDQSRESAAHEKESCGQDKTE